ncbi:MAG: DNA recombination protein RmuC [Betaproteobacteria bacterium]|nr:DNA recombination protein RmuC [Betaproteobacteria bacterium]
MSADTLTILIALLAAGLAAAAAWLAWAARQDIANIRSEVTAGDAERHRAVLTDLHDGLTKQGDRLTGKQSEEADRLRRALSEELARNRDQMQALERSLASVVEKRLDDISGKVNERLDEGFKKTNETFVSVMTRLQTIDDAQKKIESLTTSVVSLQEVLGDKRSRGAFGEMQLEQIVRNMLPESVFEFQFTFSNGVRADCVLKFPEPTGLVCVDSKFPLENYERMFAEGPERLTPAAFKADVKKHINDISSKYIIPGQTGDGAVMFVPAEAVFAEIHAHHRDLVEFAQARHVWIASPTTLMAILTTAMAVIKDVETRKQVHIIKDELNKLGADFGRFQARMDKLATHIDQAKRDVDEVQISSKKISERFAKIERVEIEAPAVSTATKPALPDLE